MENATNFMLNSSPPAGWSAGFFPARGGRFRRVSRKVRSLNRPKRYEHVRPDRPTP